MDKNYATLVMQSPTPQIEPHRNFGDLSATAEMLAARAADLRAHAERVEARLIGHGAPCEAAGAPYGHDAPKAVEPHFVATRDALGAIERHLAGAAAALNRLADSAGVDRL